MINISAGIFNASPPCICRSLVSIECTEHSNIQCSTVLLKFSLLTHWQKEEPKSNLQDCSNHSWTREKVDAKTFISILQLLNAFKENIRAEITSSVLFALWRTMNDLYLKKFSLFSFSKLDEGWILEWFSQCTVTEVNKTLIFWFSIICVNFETDLLHIWTN